MILQNIFGILQIHCNSRHRLYIISLPGVSSPRSEKDWQQLLLSALKHKFHMPCELFSDVDQWSIQNEMLKIINEMNITENVNFSLQFILSTFTTDTQRSVQLNS